MSFSTGFVFWYWPYYDPSNAGNVEKEEKIPIEYGNDRDFDGHSIAELFIGSGTRDNLKDEMLEYPDLTMSVYKERVLLKAERYFSTDHAKKTKSKKPERTAMRHYGIKQGSAVTLWHIMSLILYCDFTVICTAFSGTFRRLYPLESLESVKKRNASFYWMSRFLRELVELYGDDRFDGEKGPFYTGMSVLMVMPSMNMRLNGPTSMTKQFQIALNFAKNDGVIIELNNRYWPSKQQRVVDAAWIGQYKEEDERFTFSGSHPLQIVSVRNTNTMQNFESICKPLFYFDAALSGNGYDLFQSKQHLSAKDISSISALVEHSRGKRIECEQYVLDSFNMYCFAKKSLVINMDWISRFCPQQIQEMIFHSKSKLLRPQIVDMFVNLESIIIYSTMETGETAYPFSLPALFQMLSGKEIKCIINGVWRERANRDGARSWLFEAYRSLPTDPNIISLSLSCYQDRDGDYNDLLTVCL